MKKGPITTYLNNKKIAAKAREIANKTKETAKIKFNQIRNAIKFKPEKINVTYEALIKEYQSKEIVSMDQKLNQLEKRAEESHKKIIELKGGFLKDTNNYKVIDRKKIAQQLLKGEKIENIPERFAINPEALQPNKGTKSTNKTLKQLEAGDRELKTRELNKHFTKEKKKRMLSKEIKKEVENARTINKQIASIQAIRFNEIIKNQLNFGSAAETKQAREAIVKSIYEKYQKGIINLSGLRDLVKYLSVEIEYGKNKKIINSAETSIAYLKESAEMINKISNETEIKKRFKILNFIKSKK